MLLLIQRKIRNELTIFFANMGWSDKLKDIRSKLDLVLQSIEDVKVDIKEVKVGIEDIKKMLERQYPPATTLDVTELGKEGFGIVKGGSGFGETVLLYRIIVVDFVKIYENI